MTSVAFGNGLCWGSACMVLLASAAAAEPWDVFAERCLVPLEHFMPGRIDGLRRSETDGAGEADTLSFLVGQDGVLLHVSPGPVCRVSIESTAADVLILAREWRAEVLASGRYIEKADGALESNQWREPRLAVRIDVDDAQGLTVFAAEETDLES